MAPVRGGGSNCQRGSLSKVQWLFLGSHFWWAFGFPRVVLLETHGSFLLLVLGRCCGFRHCILWWRWLFLWCLTVTFSSIVLDCGLASTSDAILRTLGTLCPRVLGQRNFGGRERFCPNGLCRCNRRACCCTSTIYVLSLYSNGFNAVLFVRKDEGDLELLS